VGIKLFGLQNTITISGTPTAAGTFSYIPLTGGCGTVICDRTITVDPASVGELLQEVQQFVLELIALL
jgi:hypothetical protein